MSPTKLLDTDRLSNDEIQRRWEDAYVKFETPEQEIEKFLRRLSKLGQAEWGRESQIVEIFCGRGNGLRALEKLGFVNLEGVDISSELLRQYEGSATMFEADCRRLPFDDESKDIVIVQGGLHHLPALPEDLEQTLREVARVLRPDGRFVVVEPWMTPFLRAVHFMSDLTLVRSISGKFDAFATMTHYEAATYFNWLDHSESIRTILRSFFLTSVLRLRFGKLFFVGVPKKEN